MISSIAAVFLSAGTFANGRSALGTDLTAPLHDGYIRIYAGHGFKEKWSASFSADLNAGIPSRTRDEEYENHINEFDDSTENATDRNRCFRMSVCYWPGKTYDGMYLGIGCSCPEYGSPDWFVEIGYAIHIWKGLTMMISYGTDMIATSRAGRHMGNGTGIGLCWTISNNRKK